MKRTFKNRIKSRIMRHNKQTFLDQIADVKINTPLNQMSKSVIERSKQLENTDYAEELFFSNTKALER
ncbi:hypothetical protein [Jeotgalibacillus alimentarius]|uniref:hypothetical protein n=1 Tax=Jeotgalibacillus alimentarius TaxID=135826 RepID=UPI000596C8A0|nr:hypothetical protein [Jeotgalibacillus alimentarius]